MCVLREDAELQVAGRHLPEGAEEGGVRAGELERDGQRCPQAPRAELGQVQRRGDERQCHQRDAEGHRAERERNAHRNSRTIAERCTAVALDDLRGDLALPVDGVDGVFIGPSDLAASA